METTLSLVLLVAWLCVQTVSVEKSTFSSYANLLKMYYMEEEALSNVDVFLREELAEHGDADTATAAHNMTSLRKLVEEAKSVHRTVGSNPEEYLSHPINVYYLAKRLLHGWKDGIDIIRNSKPCREWHIPHVIRRLSNIEDNLPTEDQLQSIAYNLITIQHTQKLRTGDLVAGKIGQHAALTPISPEDQFRISKLAVDEDDYYYAAQWLKHLTGSEKLAEMKKEVHGFNATNVLGMLASAYFRINMLQEALAATKELLKADPSNMVAQNNKVYFEEKIARLGDSKKTARPIRYGSDDAYRRNYEALCRGALPKKNRHRCKLVPTTARLSFHKMEVLRKKPPIVAFHDVISRKDVQQIVEMSEEEYEKISLDTEFRTPNFTLVLSEVASTTKQRLLLSKIKNKFMNLPYTVVRPYKSGESETRNFGHQGFYMKPSPDFQIQGMGRNTGTFMVFLNDVTMGGDIVFPSAKARLQPTTGSVLFYFPSFKKYHAICPVAYGTEWLLIHSFFEKINFEECRTHEDPAFLDL